jgi:hypothetical protein
VHRREPKCDKPDGSSTEEGPAARSGQRSAGPLGSQGKPRILPTGTGRGERSGGVLRLARLSPWVYNSGATTAITSDFSRNKLPIIVRIE